MVDHQQNEFFQRQIYQDYFHICESHQAHHSGPVISHPVILKDGILQSLPSEFNFLGIIYVALDTTNGVIDILFWWFLFVQVSYFMFLPLQLYFSQYKNHRMYDNNTNHFPFLLIVGS